MFTTLYICGAKLVLSKSLAIVRIVGKLGIFKLIREDMSEQQRTVHHHAMKFWNYGIYDENKCVRLLVYRMQVMHVNT